ncbi:hypothetical protein [Streptomyces sp. NPDC058964]|uniref:hypothetical protein n=1 Tax=Streptomyces sp. NPDC058964 TaxID=3346681 RepID=UPI0036C1E029
MSRAAGSRETLSSSVQAGQAGESVQVGPDLVVIGAVTNVEGGADLVEGDGGFAVGAGQEAFDVNDEGSGFPAWSRDGKTQGPDPERPDEPLLTRTFTRSATWWYVAR